MLMSLSERPAAVVPSQEYKYIKMILSYPNWEHWTHSLLSQSERRNSRELVKANERTPTMRYILLQPITGCLQCLQKYAQLYSTINVEQPLKLQQLSETRWLAIAPCLTKVLQQYNELKLHFEISKHEENYTANLLNQMYSDPSNKLYLGFLQPVVSQVNRVNKMFKLGHCNVSKLLAELMSLYKSILERLMIP
ncbi:hypothetical protein Pcinc_023964 [Petrolisthes cinctipes]|uniref:Uncharacterized protein n=1 Tax=Petrolisthes cinctipes TaxID=88211 RepID=A0AAE1FBI8_PETCI|nr:hypothetical protein Pcinc_023964 [Petrolisthes cinctipes]